jgi:hypothetical protein
MLQAVVFARLQQPNVIGCGLVTGKRHHVSIVIAKQSIVRVVKCSAVVVVSNVNGEHCEELQKSGERTAAGCPLRRRVWGQ